LERGLPAVENPDCLSPHIVTIVTPACPRSK
jgi:hypothetical protein